MYPEEAVPGPDNSSSAGTPQHSAVISVLSDVLSQSESGASVLDEQFAGTDLDPSRSSLRKRKLSSIFDLSAEFAGFTESFQNIETQIKRRGHSLRNASRSDPATSTSGEVAVSPSAGGRGLSFQTLPNEVFQHIATLVPEDDDLKALILTCRQFSQALEPENSSVWRSRFLAQYDHPIIDDPHDFRVAYQLRKFVLRQFGDSSFEWDKELWNIQLTVLRDIIVEAYNPRPRQAHPSKHSRNLEACSALDKSPWMVMFLSTPTYKHSTEKYPYGRPHQLFDAVQLVFSYLLFSRIDDELADQISTSRAYYNLELVYNWGRPFGTLLTRLDDEPSPSPTFKSVLFPNLKSPTLESAKQQYQLNLHDLLHIRNFWHRHLADGMRSRFAEIEWEHTYARMMNRLHGLGRSPSAWNKPVKDAVIRDGAYEWVGHYSCLQPWPKKRTELEEAQSCAETWESIDPLTLSFTATSSNATGNWPRIFNNIPRLADILKVANPPTKPKRHHKPHQTFYLRGLAPFLDLSHAFKPPNTASSKYHPFLSLRLRGVIHTLAPQASIPGFQHITMILYKPNLTHLLLVLGHATENYGSAFTQIQPGQLSADVDTSLGLPAGAIDPEEAEIYYRDVLDRYLAMMDEKGPVRMTRQLVEKMEDSFIGATDDAPGRLHWEDIEYAYAYEGVIMPGGKMMMGRWWRCADLDADGQVIADLGADYERGPWIFWR